jgi:hypothetical protein
MDGYAHDGWRAMGETPSWAGGRVARRGIGPNLTGEGPGREVPHTKTPLSFVFSTFTPASAGGGSAPLNAEVCPTYIACPSTDAAGRSPSQHAYSLSYYVTRPPCLYGAAWGDDAPPFPWGSPPPRSRPPHP